MKLAVGKGWVHILADRNVSTVDVGVLRLRSEDITLYATGVAFVRNEGTGWIEWWPNEQIRKVEFDGEVTVP